MKLCTTLASLSLAGLALASSSQPEPAEAYTIRRPSPAREHGGEAESVGSIPQIPRQLARHILLQRAAGSGDGDDHSSLLADLPDDLALDRALDLLNSLGREPLALFHDASSSPASSFRRPSVVLVLEGATEATRRSLRDGLVGKGLAPTPAFTVSDPPSAEANLQLAERDLRRTAAACAERVADLAPLLKSRDDRCWDGFSLFAKYDLAKESANLDLDSILTTATEEDMDLLLLLVPESSRTTGPSTWSTAKTPVKEPHSAELRRRNPQFDESVMEDETASAGTHKTATTSKSSGFHIFDGENPSAPSSTGPAKRILACYNSQSACANATDSCSGHGECVNKYADPDRTPCFVCACSVVENADGRSRTFWAGKACEKRDVSTPFWLIAGLTVSLIGMVSFSIGLLFNVGEETLPGVIGAGVSRSTK